MSKFGIIIPGRPVDTDFTQVDLNKFLITINDAHLLNHIVVFLNKFDLPPPDVAACIFFSMPDPSSPPVWHFLGALNVEKQSAVFKITNLAQSHKLMLANGVQAIIPTASLPNSLGFNYTQAPVMHVAQIGISLEPVAAVVGMVPAIETTTSNLNSFVEFMNKTVSNLYNYCTSFSSPLGQLTAREPPNREFVPLTALQTWYETYSTRLKNDQNFWKTLN